MALQLMTRVKRGLLALSDAASAKLRVGTEASSGFAVTSGVPDIDYLDDLGYPEYLKEFKRLANDAQVAKELRANTLPIIGADWTMEPPSDEPRDLMIAEFASANILNLGGKNFGRAYWQHVSWDDRLRDILRFLQNGFAVFQKVYRYQSRFRVFDKIKYLQPETMERWLFEDEEDPDRLTTVLRTYMNARGKMVTREPIDASELVIYTWDKEGSNILGKPLIRPMWRDYKMKDALLTLMMVDKQKNAVGVPYFQLQAEATPDDHVEAEKLLKHMRAGKFEKTYAVLKDGQDFGWKEGGTSDKNLPALVTQRDEGIQKVGASRLSELGGEHSAGSRGVAGGVGAFEADMKTACARSVVMQEQRNVIELIDANFANVTRYPQLKVSRIDPFEQTRSVPEFVSTISAGAVQADLETENEIRRRYGFMERAEDAEDPPGAEGDEGDEGDEGLAPEAIGDNEPEPGADTDSSVSPPSLAHRHSLDAAEDEAVKRAMVSTDKIEGRLEIQEGRYLTIIRGVLRDMREELVELVRSGALQPTRATQVRVPFQDELRDRLLALVRQVRDFGRDQVRAELDRQVVRAGKQKLVGNPATRRGAVSFANQQGEVNVNLDITALVQRLQAQVVAEYNRLLSQQLDADEIASGLKLFFKSVSEKQSKDMARQSTAVAFNMGRNIAIQEMRTVLQPYAVRIEMVNDPNCCRECKRLHEKRVLIGSKAYQKYAPPSYCLGKRRCRGFWAVFPR